MEEIGRFGRVVRNYVLPYPFLSLSILLFLPCSPSVIISSLPHTRPESMEQGLWIKISEAMNENKQFFSLSCASQVFALGMKVTNKICRQT